MKAILRKLFAFILKPLESGSEPYGYRPSHRMALNGMGFLFTVLGTVMLYLTMQNGDLGYLLPVFVFAGGGIVCLIIGLLGNDRAVAKIWGTK